MAGGFRPVGGEVPRILGGDGRLLWVYKPAGIPCLPPHRDPEGPCVLRWLALAGHLPEGHFPAGFPGGIAHRLDVPTSGVIAVARDPASLLALRAAFRERLLEKRYLLVSAGEVPWDRHHVAHPLAHHRRRRGRMVVARGRDTPHRGRWYPAETTFARRERTGTWEARMRTGVTHQVRAHAAFVGIALLGDRRYGGAPLPPGAPAGAVFLLHHVGMAGRWPDGSPLRSPEPPPPRWWDDVLASLRDGHP